ncbi:hypothetical protein Ae201684_006749 [Aphanomyces euteiches]|uniref:Ubiquitin-like domain-containing protein n=1 Tax=Aphanomyces euteiches TaxID=100861 RepID=A0A6G0XC59_9STRA|nr:hypothetical protein Ae201684_006749 [Aphanomyces euteiches]
MSAHVLPRDVFKTLVRLDGKLDWRASESDLARQLHLPETYITRPVTPTSQFVGPGPGQYDPHDKASSPTQRSHPLSSFASQSQRSLHFVPREYVAHETYREGPFSLPEVQQPKGKQHHAPRLRRRHRRRQPVQPEATTPELPKSPSAPLPLNGTKSNAPAFSFATSSRADIISETTPSTVSPATYNARPPWELGSDMASPRVIVGFHSSVARDPTWMGDVHDQSAAELYRQCVKVKPNKLKEKPRHLSRVSHLASSSSAPEFDAFQWLRTHEEDGPQRVEALQARTAELLAIQTVPEERSSDESHSIAITCVLPTGFAMTYRVSPSRTVASLKHLIAKKVSSTPSRLMRQYGNEIYPEMLSLYLQGKLLVDSHELGVYGVEERMFETVCTPTVSPPTMEVTGRRLATYFVLHHMHGAMHVRIPETAFIDDEGVMVDWYFVSQTEQIVLKKNKVQHTNVMLFELRLQELATARHTNELAVQWENHVALLTETQLDEIVRMLCIREANMTAVTPNLTISRILGRFCLQEYLTPLNNMRYIAHFTQPRHVDVFQCHYLSSLDPTRLVRDRCPLEIESILKQCVHQVVGHLRSQRCVAVEAATLEWIFIAQHGRDVPVLIGAQSIRAVEGVAMDPRSEPFVKLQREREDLHSSSPKHKWASHAAQRQVCRQCQQPRELELSKELVKTQKLLREALAHLQKTQEELQVSRAEGAALKKKVNDLDVTVCELHNQLKASCPSAGTYFIPSTCSAKEQMQNQRFKCCSTKWKPKLLKSKRLMRASWNSKNSAKMSKKHYPRPNVN